MTGLEGVAGTEEKICNMKPPEATTQWKTNMLYPYFEEILLLLSHGWEKMLPINLLGRTYAKQLHKQGTAHTQDVTIRAAEPPLVGL